MIADPELPNKTAAGRMSDLVPCVYCVNCLAVDRECTVNPAWGKEREHAIVPAARARKVLVVGGGPGGMEAARVAALRGHEVTLVDTNEGPAFGERPMPVLREFMTAALAEHGTAMLTAARYEQVTGKGLVIVDKAGRRELIEGDTVIFAAEHRSDTELAQSLKNTPCELHLVGDCVKACGILDAIRDGYMAARAI